MVSEVLAGLSAFKSMMDIAKGLKDINDATIRNAVVIELQSKILSAQMEQAALISRIGELEKEVASFEAWDAEKQRYELKEIAPRTFAYALKAEAQSTEPFHLICPNCYQHRNRSILQGIESATFGWLYNCPSCKHEICVGFERRG